MPGLADGEHTVCVRAVDGAKPNGNVSAAKCVNFKVDRTPPKVEVGPIKQLTIPEPCAPESGPDLCIENSPSAPSAVQGKIKITVCASDDTCGLDGKPTVTVTPFGGSPEDITPTGVLCPSGCYVYIYEVKPDTPDDAALVNACVLDNAGNSGCAQQHFVINKSEITVNVELQALNPPASGCTRCVTFVATDSAGGKLQPPWTLCLVFPQHVDTLPYRLTGVPKATAHLSAKTDWNLRRTLDVVLDANGQATVNFTGLSKLLGGDINGDNVVDILDYGLMKKGWFSSDAKADCDCSKYVNLGDYAIIRLNMFKRGDPE